VVVELVLPAGAEAIVPIPLGHEGFLYPFEGSVIAGEAGEERTLARGELGVLGAGEHVRVRSGGAAARALVVAGKPLREPVVQHGPFVMNTADEIRQAIRDFEAGRF
jgi:redox-sensitive bicupin YhaK (pirin superfamily)